MSCEKHLNIKLSATLKIRGGARLIDLANEPERVRLCNGKRAVLWA